MDISILVGSVRSSLVLVSLLLTSTCVAHYLDLYFNSLILNTQKEEAFQGQY